MIDVRPYGAMHVPQQPVQRFGRVLVEIAGRFVSEQHGRLHDQRTRDCHALLFTAGEHAGPMGQPLTESDARAAVPRPGRGTPAASAARDAHRHLDVLERGELRQQMVKLEDEPDVSVPERHDLGIGQRGQHRAVDDDGPLLGAIEPAEDVQQRALAGARCADDGEHLARRRRRCPDRAAP